MPKRTWFDKISSFSLSLLPSSVYAYTAYTIVTFQMLMTIFALHHVLQTRPFLLPGRNNWHWHSWTFHHLSDAFPIYIKFKMAMLYCFSSQILREFLVPRKKIPHSTHYLLLYPTHFARTAPEMLPWEHLPEIFEGCFWVVWKRNFLSTMGILGCPYWFTGMYCKKVLCTCSNHSRSSSPSIEK